MRIIFTILLSLFLLQSQGQSVIARQNVDQFPTNPWGGQCYGLTWLPQSYASTSRTYPLIIFLHGAGETGTTIANLSKITNANPRSIPGRIGDGWNAIAVNPLTGVQDSFIVISPQAASWSFNYTELKHILPNILSRYRVDTTRIYLTGLSAGGGGVFSTFGSRDTAFIKKFAAMSTASSAGTNASNGYTSVEVEAGLRFGSLYGVRMWTIAGEADYLLNTDVRYHDSTNKPSPPTRPNKLTVIASVGHSAWGRAYDTAFRPIAGYYGSTGACNNGCNNGGITVSPNANGSAVRGSGVTQDSLNMYEWFLTNSRSTAAATAPTAYAGLNDAITLPTSSYTLNGSGTAGTGYTISSYFWEKLSGPSCTIASPSSASTNVTGMSQGTYVFRLTLTNSNSATAQSSVTIIVNPAGAHTRPLTNAGVDQEIRLPTDSTTVTGTTTLYDGATQTITWSNVKSPGQVAYKILAIGSSTVACFGVTIAECWRTKLEKYYDDTLGLLTVDTVYNLGINGGATIFGMDITASLNAGGVGTNKLVILHYPSNGYNGGTYTNTQILNRFREVRDSVLNRGYKLIVMGTQPREDFSTGDRTRLNVLNDSLALIFTTSFVNVMKIAKASATDTWKTVFNLASHDGVHGNGAYHTEIVQAIKAVNPFKLIASSSATISTPSTASTDIKLLTEGEHIFNYGVIDDYGYGHADAIKINVLPSLPSPTANAGTDQTITPPTTITTLTGSGTAGSGTITGYQWTKISGPTVRILSPNSAVTDVDDLVPNNTYVFRLTITNSNSLSTSDDVIVTVTPFTGCSGIRYEADPFDNGGYYNDIDLLPGDTLDLQNKTFQFVVLINKSGTAACPIVIINSGGVAWIKGATMYDGNVSQLSLISCKYIKVTGTGSGDQYGIRIQPYQTDSLRNGSFAFSITGKSKNIEVENLRISNAGIGMNVKDDGGCDTTFNYPNWVIDSIFIHDNYVSKTWNQGMYIGNTSPDNGVDSYSPRPVVCLGVTTYPRPARMGNIRVWNNIVDSTGRPGIQVSSASTGYTEIWNNTVKHNGMNGDPAQGSAIVIGAYTKAYIHNNTVSSTYSDAIASQGGSGTGYTQRIEANTIDSAGYQRHYDLSANPPIDIHIPTRTTYTNTTTFPYSIFMATKPTENPIDSTRFQIIGNTVGIRKAATDIGFADYRNTFHKSGNVVCNNVRSAGGAATIQQEEAITVYYSTSCGLPPYVIRISRGSRLKFRRN